MHTTQPVSYLSKRLVTTLKTNHDRIQTCIMKSQTHQPWSAQWPLMKSWDRRVFNPAPSHTVIKCFDMHERLSRGFQIRISNGFSRCLVVEYLAVIPVLLYCVWGLEGGGQCICFGGVVCRGVWLRLRDHDWYQSVGKMSDAQQCMVQIVAGGMHCFMWLIER